MLKYVGQGAFIVGVPSRDLNDAEVKEHGGEQKLIASGIYKRADGQTTRVKQSEVKDEHSEDRP